MATPIRNRQDNQIR